MAAYDDPAHAAFGSAAGLPQHDPVAEAAVIRYDRSIAMGPTSRRARGRCDACASDDERVVDRSAHAYFVRAKHARDLGSARRLVVVRSASGGSVPPQH
jgi:hypothetical protein